MQRHTLDPVLACPTGTKGNLKQEKAPQGREVGVKGGGQGVRGGLCETRPKGG